MKKEFLTGSEVVVRACKDAGAVSMYGYPITPGTEILSNWIKTTEKNNNLKYLQTEDEIASGFGVCGAVIAGEKSFTATAGPGTVLMQDAMSMADGMRLPFVAIIAQRGGPSSGTVIYSQQEVNLAIHGGNGEGMRLVYSPSNLEELYVFTRKAFNNAWKYRFPTVVLTDGFLLKTKQNISLDSLNEKNEDAVALVDEHSQKNIRNIYTFEEELHEFLENTKKDFEKMAEAVTEYEVFQEEGAEHMIIAHGIVAGAAKEAIEILREQGEKVALFIPKTLSPFPKEKLNEIAKGIHSFFVVESSMGQLNDLVKQNCTEMKEIKGLFKPAVGIEAEEIVEAFIQSK
ncbi:MAG: ferredoxin oxidoreductase [Candidatus Magasanikbacteria bacterium]